MGWKSLKAVILRAPLCGANNIVATNMGLALKRHRDALARLLPERRNEGCNLHCCTQSITVNYAPSLKKDPAKAIPRCKSLQWESSEKNVVLESEN